MAGSRTRQILHRFIAEIQTDYVENFVGLAESNPDFAESILSNYKFGERDASQGKLVRRVGLCRAGFVFLCCVGI